MFKPTDVLSHRSWLWLAMVLAVLAAPTFGAPFGADPERAEALLEQLGDRYEVLTLTDSYVLQPIDTADFAAIEIKAGSVAVDGETLTPAELRDLVGDDAAIIEDLSELGSAEWSATEELRRRIERLAREERRLQGRGHRGPGAITGRRASRTSKKNT